MSYLSKNMSFSEPESAVRMQELRVSDDINLEYYYYKASSRPFSPIAWYLIVLFLPSIAFNPLLFLSN